MTKNGIYSPTDVLKIGIPNKIKHKALSTSNGLSLGKQFDEPDNVVQTTINHPFGNGSYQLFMVKLGMVYYCLAKGLQFMCDIEGKKDQGPNASPRRLFSCVAVS